MTLCLDIITRAGRAIGILSAGQVPAGQDAADLMEHLQDAINSLPLLRDGAWTEVTLTSAAGHAASDGERINTAGLAAAITLPTTRQEGGESLAQRDLARVQIIGGEQAGLWLFPASLGVWRRADELAVSDELPFGPEDEAGLAAIVAVSAAGEYGEGGSLPPVYLARAQRQIASFRARFYRDVTVRAADEHLALSDQGHGTMLQDLG